jgi:hypothetical protein
MTNDPRLQAFIESHPDGVSSELVMKLKGLTQDPDRESAIDNRQ